MAPEGKEASPRSREAKDVVEDWDLERALWGVRNMSNLRLEHFVRAFSMEALWVRGNFVGVGVVVVGVWWRLEVGWRKAWWRAWARTVESVSSWMCSGMCGFGGVVSSRVSRDMELSL